MSGLLLQRLSILLDLFRFSRSFSIARELRSIILSEALCILCFSSRDCFLTSHERYRSSSRPSIRHKFRHTLHQIPTCLVLVSFHTSGSWFLGRVLLVVANHRQSHSFEDCFRWHDDECERKILVTTMMIEKRFPILGISH